jgi:hypothetical protein
MSGYFKWDSANIEIPNNANTYLTFNSERYDTAGMHSLTTNTGRLTCTIAGIYLIGCCVRWANDTTYTGMRTVGITLNSGRTRIVWDYRHVGTTYLPAMGVSTVYPLSVGDYVELEVYQNRGSPLNVEYASNYSPEFWTQRMA